MQLFVFQLSFEAFPSGSGQGQILGQVCQHDQQTKVTYKLKLS